jgi:O-antigen/teichoic acid export membrane protein
MTARSTTTAESPEDSVGALRIAAASSVKWAVLQTVGSTGGRLLFTLVIIRFLGPGDFGIVAQATIYITLAMLLLDQGFGVALIQRREVQGGDIRSVATLNVVLAAGLCGLTLVLAPTVAAFFKTPELTTVLRVLACGLIVKGLAIVPTMMTRRAFDFRKLAILQTSAVVLGGISGLIVVAAGAGYWALVVQALATDCLVLLGLLRLHGLPRFGLDVRRLRNMFGFSIGLLGAQLLLFVGQNADNVAIGRVLGSTALAYYALSYRLMRFPLQLIGSAVNDVSLPIFSRLQDDARRLEAWFLTATRFITVLTWPILVLIAVAAELAVPLVFGERWSPAVVPLQLLSLGALTQISRWLFSPICASRGRTDVVFGWSAAIVGLLVVSFAISVHWGINAVAASLALAGLVTAVPQTLHVCRVARVSAGGFARAHVAAAVGCLVLAGLWMLTSYVLDRVGLGDAPIVMIAALIAIASYLLIVRIVWPTVGVEARTMLRLTRQRRVDPEASIAVAAEGAV